jgi:hypothetical protein
MSCIHWVEGCQRSRRRSLPGVLAVFLVVVLVSGGAPVHADLVINPIFDSSITSDPNAAAIEGVINAAILVYEKTFSDPISVNINFAEMTSGLGSSSTFFATVSYSQYYNALKADATTADDATALARLGIDGSGPNNPVTGTSLINVKTANLRAVGINVNPPSGQPDGFIGLNTHITFPGSPGSSLTYSLMSTAMHEIDEVLGLGSAINFSSSPFSEDLFRFDGSGNRSFTASSTALAYFSIDGTTKLAQFDNQNDGGDFGDWQSNPLPPGVAPQVQDAFATPFANPSLGPNELTALDVIGYNRISAVPEPGSVSVVGTVLLVVSVHGWCRRRRRAGQTVV